MSDRDAKKLAIITEGGLGDQLCAEPTLRFLVSRMGTERITLYSDLPDLFSHLPIPCSPLHAWDPRRCTNEVGISTLHGLIGDPPLRFSQPLFHLVDLVSINVLRRQLPLRDREIRLNDFQSEQDALSRLCETDALDRLVLIHPGRGWSSKTFPPDVWRSYVDALRSENYPVAVIGKNEGETGTVDLDLSQCINLVDQLTLRQLIALISMAPLLISNDSAPVHVAGAFDNWIGLISTAKDPDLVLPYRSGTVFHKARSLEKAQLYARNLITPLDQENRDISRADSEELRPCLPNARDIVDFTRSVLNGTAALSTTRL